MGNCSGHAGSRERSGNRQVEVDPAEASIGDGRPLKKEEWASNPPLDRAEIERRRKEFWDTAPAYEGRREIWDALKAACDEDDTTMAQAILTASDIKLPHGSLTVCFDATGTKYIIPRFCICYPTNMIESIASPEQAPSCSTRNETSRVSPQTHDSTSLSQGSSEKCSDVVKIKCRLSIGEDVFLDCEPTDIALHIKESLYDSKKIAMSRMRIYFVGKPVPDQLPIANLGLGRNDVLQIMILPAIPIK